MLSELELSEQFDVDLVMLNNLHTHFSRLKGKVADIR